MYEYEAGIIRTECRGEKTCIIHLSCDAIAREAVPGQFVQVRVGDGTDPFLRRTFSIYGVDREHGLIKLMLDIVGRGTEQMAAIQCGEFLNIIGPLGKGFDLEPNKKGTCVLIAGGVGTAPLFFLSDRLIQSEKKQIIFMIGTRTASAHSAYEGMFDEHVSVMKATDDGSAGYHGTVSDLLEKHIESIHPSVLYTCGPHLMMKAVAVIARKKGIRCQVSLEERMACGLGACYGCAVRLRDGSMVRSCVDGPVFDANEVNW